MVPGFTGSAITAGLEVVDHAPAAQLAVWDVSPHCRPINTDTFCTGVVLWCKDNYRCWDPKKGVYLWSNTPYPCGVCVGISDPSDW